MHNGSYGTYYSNMWFLEGEHLLMEMSPELRVHEGGKLLKGCVCIRRNTAYIQIDKQTRRQTAFSSDEAGRPNAAEFLDFWRKRFSVQLQKCNVQVISEKLSMLCGGSERPDSLSTQFFPH